MRKKFRAMVSLFLTFCMAVSMLSSPGLAAEPGQSSLLVIEGFKNFDCYGTEPYQQLDDYDPEIASLPENVQAIWSNGESSELSVSWDLVSRDSEIYEWEIRLPENVALSDELETAVREKRGRLPWIRAVLPKNPLPGTDTVTDSQLDTESTDTVIDSQPDTEPAESVTESVEDDKSGEESFSETETLIETETSEEMGIVSETEKKEIPESTVDEEDELTDQHSYNIIVRENFSGICLSVGGKSSALPGETVYVSADTDNMSAGMYFNGITVRTSDEKSLETAYDVSCGMYRFIMPESDVAVTPSYGWITLMANSIGTTHTVTNYSTMMNQGSLMVGYFEIDGGTLAWCTQHSLDPPIIGRRMMTAQIWSDNSTWLSTMMRRIAFYGYSGQRAEETKARFGLDDPGLWRYTSLAYSYAYGGDDNFYGYGAAMVDWLSSLGNAANAPDSLKVYRLTSGSSSMQDLVYWEVETEPEEKDGWLQVHKTVEGHLHDGRKISPEGAIYKVYTDPQCTQVVANLYIGADGYSQKSWHPLGTYYVKEYSAPPGLDVDPKIYTVEIKEENNETTPVMVESVDTTKQDYGFLQVYKKFEGENYTYDPDRDPAFYTIYADKECKYPAYTLAGDNASTFRVESYGLEIPDGYATGKIPIPYGTYYIKETRAPQNYALDPTVYEVVIDERHSDVSQPMTIMSANVPLGYLRIEKSSANKAITNGNGCYTLKGGVYGVYSDQGCMDLIDTLTTNDQGVSETIALEADTYYVKEIEAPPGFALDDTVYTVPVTMNDTQTQPVVVQSVEEPLNDPLVISITKTDAQTGTSGAQGGTALAGAQFTIKYYDGYYTKDNLPQTPDRTWVIETKKIVKDGKTSYTASLSEDCKVSGDDFYYDGGQSVLPLGTISVMETKAPDGYTLDGAYLEPSGGGERVTGMYVAQIKAQGAAAHLEGGNVYIAGDYVGRGGVKIQKVDADTRKPIAQGDASLEGAVYAIITNNDAPVIIDGKTYNKGAELLLLTTNNLGQAGTSNDAIPLGQYKIGEVDASTGYLINNTVQSFEIETVGQIVSLENSLTEPVIRGGVKVQKRDAETGGTVAQGEATVEGATFQITNQSAADVVVDGRTYAPGAVITTIRTNDQGIAQTANDLLPYGTYKIKEIGTPTGYLGQGVTERTFSIRQNGVLVDMTGEDQSILNDVIRGGVKVQKRDAETGSTTPQGDATFKDAAFQIINSSAKAVMVGGKSYDPGQVVTTIKTNDQGLAQTANNLLPYGTYTIKETGAPTGYLGQGVTQRTFSIRQNGVLVDMTGEDQAILNDVIRGGVKVQKRDNETGSTTPQGDATFKGATFQIINASAKAVLIGGKPYDPGDVVTTITTNDRGVAQTAADLLPYGTYIIKENGAPSGYLGEGVTERAFSIRQEGVVVDMMGEDQSILNDVIRGGVKVQKRDVQSGDAAPEGSATFEGAVFTLTNISENPVIVDGKSYEPDEVVAQMTTDENGLAQTAPDLLPYGTYKITEITAPRGYLGEGILERTFSIREDGVIVDMTGEDQAIHNQVIRGDFELTKIDSDTQNAMANIPFKITSNTTGESHTFTTDANGFYSSASTWNLHSYNTNGGGAQDGLWFGLDAEGNQVAVNDDLGALPFDTYTIEELRCEANADKVLYKGTLTISRDGYTVDMGNIENETVNTPAIYTSARNEDTGTAYGIAQAGTAIIDTVAYTGLTPGATYTLQGTLMNAATGETVMDGDTPVTAQKSFTAILENGTIDVEFVFDASGLSGADVVVFEKLFYEGEEVASHEDLQDEGQTIHFPGIGTTATDSATGTHIGTLQESTTLVDTVAYTNLQIGRSYTLTGTLMDQATGLPQLSANGQEITVTKTFIPQSSNGTVDMSFVLNTSDLAGKSVVVFEQLSRGIVVYATHEDINDEGQTVHFPEIGTTAVDGVTGDHMGNAGVEEVTVIDTVAYENLVPGKEYTVSGTLMDKATGKALTYDGKTFIAEKTFTPKEANGSIELTFTVPGAALLGKAVVAFEDLAYEGITVGTHADISDEDQTVYYPQISTTATDSVTGSHYTLADEKVTIKDTVTYQTLIPGKTYVMTGTLMDKGTGDPIMDGEEPLTVTQAFTPKTSDGSLEMAFTLDASALSGSDVVVFENLTLDGTLLAFHEDLEDEGQTIHFPKIGTTALDSETKDHIGKADSEVTLVDTVTYENLEPGTEYILTGTLMDKVTGEALVIGDKAVTTEVTFTPEKSSGSVDVTFRFDGTTVAGKDLVAFEELYMDSYLLASHKDLEDEGQTVHFPKIRTTATDSETGDHTGNAAVEKVTIIDAVTYTNLIPGKEYTVNGTLMDKSTGEALTYDGQTFTATETFTPDKANGSIDLTFTVPGAALLGKAVVAFEDVTYEGISVGTHADINDEDQTVYYPQIGTVATDSVTGTHYALADEKVTIKDTATYTGLLPGRAYVMTGTLMDKGTGKPIMDGKESLTVTKEFMPETSDGSLEMMFTFNASALDGSDVVAFEKLTLDGTLLASHEDLEDEGQTIHFPKIGTTALDSETKDHIGKADSEDILVDTVTYENLEPGTEYTLTGTLIDKATGEVLVIGDKAVTTEVTFTPEKSSGSVDVTFRFDGTTVAGKDLVAFEELYMDSYLLASHKDLEDEGQTVHFPKIRTTATDSETGDHMGNAAVEEVTIIDTVTYTNLIPGKEYTVSGTLMDKSTGEKLTYDGKIFTTTETFIPEEANGSIELTFTIPGKALMGKAAVVFEDVTYEGVSVGTHADISDEDQTVYYPQIGTTATDQLTGTHQGFVRENVVLVDEVAYKGVKTGHEYAIEGVLMDKSTGEPYMVNGQEVRVKKTFIAKNMEGSVTLEFVFDGTDIKDDTSFVVFESLYYKDKEVGRHKDLTDEGQTVNYPKVDLGTEARDQDSGTHEAEAKERVTIIDTVSYTNLIPDREYQVQGILMDKDTEDPFLVDGEPVTAQITFVPEQAEGTVEMEFKFDGTGLENKSLVVFESLFYEDVEIAVHEDINDMGQTVTIDIPDTSDHEIPQTGLSSTVGLMAGSGAGLTVLGLSLLIRFRKKHHKPKI